MICRQINAQTNESSNQILKLEFKQQNSAFALNDELVRVEFPIRFHTLANRTRIYLNPDQILEINTADLSAFEQVLRSNHISSLKVPNQRTRQLVGEYAEASNCAFVHCGTFISTHECFIQIKEQQVVIKNQENQVLLEQHVKSAQFDDQQKKISFGQKPFYFWQPLSYMEAKSMINQIKDEIEHIEVIRRENENMFMQQEEEANVKERMQQMQDQKVQGIHEPELAANQPQRWQKIQQEALQQQQQQLPLNEHNHPQQQQQGKQQQQQQEEHQVVQEQQPLQQQVHRQEHVQEHIQEQKRIKLQEALQPQQPKVNEHEMQEEPEINKEQVLNIQPMQVRVPGVTPPDNLSPNQSYQNQDQSQEAQEVEEAEEVEKQQNKMFPKTKMIKKQQKPGVKNNKNEAKKGRKISSGSSGENENEPLNQSGFETPAKNVEDSEDPLGNKYSDEILNTVFKMALKIYNQGKYRLELCCLNGCDVIDIRCLNSKQYLYYSTFKEGKQAESKELCELKYVNEEEGIEQEIKPTRLLYHPGIHSVFYNDLNREYLHEYCLETQQQKSHYITKVALDLAMNSNGIIIGIHKNSIFSFDALEKERVMIAKYKTVKDLSKMSNFFEERHFAIASQDGIVRIFDINVYGKATNKFKMPPGITSLQISDSGNYILCRYGHKAQIISCKDKYQESMFETRTRFQDRNSVKKLLKGYSHLSHLQFLHSNDKVDNMIAVDDNNPCRLVIKNVVKDSHSKMENLDQECSQIEYLSCYQNWIIYNKDGVYYRQQIA